ncbi:NEDD8-activating enzyme E1 regulatory subunit [Cyclospora cayetanensis]|uniref:NEDD8-activating enzyme E1 regulatory subunit n=1 Tax=Cyclospora cayetanensis TaxID=88456 RepID=A0A6P6S0M1_9EIME|nr:NEDD8-activating enzyme E1 regulatory subunit [Cyclospora cayetanensis]
MRHAKVADAQSSSERYDRQLRIWGDGGQLRLRNANILILGSGTTATEALRNLVLPGIGQFVVVDDSRVVLSDVNENFFLSPEDIGDLRCRAIAKRAVELNPAVRGEAWGLSAYEYLLHHARLKACASSESFPLPPVFSFPDGSNGLEMARPPPICAFDVVVSSLMSAEAEEELLRICSQESPASLPFAEECTTELSLSAAPPDVREGRGHARRQVPVVFIGSLGFFGWVRLWAGEYCLVDTKPESSPVDLRIANPFAQLLEFASSFDLDSMADSEHCHVPFIVILIKAVCSLRGLTPREAATAAAEGTLDKVFTFPVESDVRQKIKDTVLRMQRSHDEANFEEALANVYRAVGPVRPSEEVVQIMMTASSLPAPSNTFWGLCRALHKFFMSEKALPVRRLTMDMTADTSSYVALQRVYAQKALEDEQKMRKLVDEELRQHTDGATPPPAPSVEELQCFLKNAANIKVIRYPRASEHTFGSASQKLLAAAAQNLSQSMQEPCAGADADESGQHHIPWFIAVLACKAAADKRGRFPGTLPEVTYPTGEPERKPNDATKTACTPAPNQLLGYDADLASDIAAVTEEVKAIEKILGSKLTVAKEIIEQVVRYRGSEFPTTAALIGAVAAQETIKLVCRQFEPLNNTFLWNGTERRGVTLEI